MIAGFAGRAGTLVCWLVASAWAGEPTDVRRAIGQGVDVNWTRLEVEVVGRAVDPTLKLDSKPLEQRAISLIDERVGADCGRVPVRADALLSELAGKAATDARNGWSIREGRYYADGPVEIVGVVALQPLLAGWMRQRAVPGPPLAEGGVSGVLIDLRGQVIRPTYAPRVLGPEGEVLFDSVLWDDVAFLRAPVVWVSDPAHAEARRAGGSPAFFVATARDTDIVLSAEDAARFLAEVVPTRAIGDGSVVLVVDP
jgi:hypothetical protein